MREPDLPSRHRLALQGQLAPEYEVGVNVETGQGSEPCRHQDEADIARSHLEGEQAANHGGHDFQQRMGLDTLELERTDTAPVDATAIAETQQYRKRDFPR